MSEPSVVTVCARTYELDAYGHVNHAVTAQWLEHGRSVFLRDRELSYSAVEEEYGVRVVVARQEIDYRREVRVDDRLTVTTRIERLGRASITFAQAVLFPDGGPAAEARVTMVCIDPGGGGSTPLPDDLRRRLET